MGPARMLYKEDKGGKLGKGRTHRKGEGRRERELCGQATGHKPLTEAS